MGGGGLAAAFRRPRRQEPLDLGFGDAMVAAARGVCADLALIDPLLQRGIADAEALGGLSDGQQGHMDRVD